MAENQRLFEQQSLAREIAQNMIDNDVFTGSGNASMPGAPSFEQFTYGQDFRDINAEEHVGGNELVNDGGFSRMIPPQADHDNLYNSDGSNLFNDGDHSTDVRGMDALEGVVTDARIVEFVDERMWIDVNPSEDIIATSIPLSYPSPEDAGMIPSSYSTNGER